MSTESFAFANLYLVSAVAACAAVPMRLASWQPNFQRLVSGLLVLPLIAAYLIGMHRSAGIDFDTYSVAYDDTGQAIPDLGYTALTWLTRSLGIGFSTFLLLQGLFTLIVLWVVSEAKRADPLVVLVIYLLHLAVVRDMSQSRIGLAVALYLLGQTRQRALPKVLLYICAASVHITVVVVMFVWFYAQFVGRLKPISQFVAAYVPLIAFSIGGVLLLNLASGLDPRVEIYLSWDEAAYGAPLESFGALLRSGTVLLIYFAASHRFPGLKLRSYVLMELAGAAILIGFSRYSIFAARLANVAISMYPIGIGIIALAYRSRLAEQSKSLRYRGAVQLAVAATMLTLLVRPGSREALVEVVPTAFEAFTR